VTALAKPLRASHVLDHLILIGGVVVMIGPVLLLVMTLFSGLDPTAFWALARHLWENGVSSAGASGRVMLVNSLVLALGLALIKGAASLLAAYVLVFFRIRWGGLIYGAILLTMFFPIESRILPTFLVAGHLGLLNSYAGMILPIAASGLGVLVFRQYLMQFPYEVLEAARIDGAGPVKILVDIVLPMSLPMVAALFAILFVLGWNQYVWPIMIATTSQDHDTLVRGMANGGLQGESGMALAFLALVPPGIVDFALRRWLVRGLTAGIH